MLACQGKELNQIYAHRFLRLYILFAALILAGALTFALLLNNRLEQNVRTADLSLAKALAKRVDPGADATQFTREFESWVEVAGIEGPAHGYRYRFIAHCFGQLPTRHRIRCFARLEHLATAHLSNGTF